ncbi:MAG: MBL fold metallo-hydrolase [Nitrososphaerota archaeon]|nr:MBL fold metallo-hydrolase [Nitrososphaerota archaeon]MDG6930616.1 MBL fold metallo-hydrolase [Nitrososphaerota archaeon]MDG6932759.1 MBL fold metallo-hydrolase [Nitrososphaerota archaeon]MDG6935852.1 MBL fold metallo-hydrolase [Nitrososphaerota archaeon]MDG6944173.1 MBL fold metallo-hydrolase [Nitrososphaerota archaeon]
MVKYVKTAVLNDNEGTEGLHNGWGWSVLLESEKWKIIFDAGPDPKILQNNASTMGINLDDLSFGFLSHDHFDHSGGFAALPGLKVYVPEISNYLKSAGVVQTVVSKPVELAEGVWSSGAIRGLTVVEHSILVKHDRFGNIMVVGCSHPGIDVMLDLVTGIYGKVRLLTGGFHNPPLASMNYVMKNADVVLPAHCSGSRAKAMAKMKKGYIEIRTGIELAIDENGAITYSNFPKKIIL